MDEIDKLWDNISTNDNNDDSDIEALLVSRLDIAHPDHFYKLTNELKSSDPSVKYYIIKNLDRFLKTAGGSTARKHLLSEITSQEFINDIINHYEIVFEYVKKISHLSIEGEEKVEYL